MDSINTRLHNAKLGAAIENATNKLPEDWTIILDIGSGYYCISLLDSNGEKVEIDDRVRNVADSINNALITAESIANDNREAKTFGEFKITERGFGLIEFEDATGLKCSLQQSSAIAIGNNEDVWVWLGIDNVKPMVMKSEAKKLGLELPPDESSCWMPYPIPEIVHIPTRMHLNREQVKGLVERLQQWLSTGEFTCSNESNSNVR